MLAKRIYCKQTRWLLAQGLCLLHAAEESPGLLAHSPILYFPKEFQQLTSAEEFQRFSRNITPWLKKHFNREHKRENSFLKNTEVSDEPETNDRPNPWQTWVFLRVSWRVWLFLRRNGSS